MILAYGTRLVCLCLEMVFLVNLAASAIVLGLSRQAGRTAVTMRPRQAARLFLTLRLLPFALSLGVAVSLCIPSYLRYEPNVGGERIGIFCLAASVLGLAICLIPLLRGTRVLAQSYFTEQSLPRFQPSTTTEMGVCFAEEDGSGMPLVALVGILRPRLIVAPRLLKTLSAEQLEAALSHERAHQRSWDNLKRLLVTTAPGILPCVRGFGEIERCWARYAELAADDYATCGRADRSVALAEALIQVARLGNAERRIPLASSLSAGDLELAMRVERLMAIDSTTPPQPGSRKFLWNSSLIFAASTTFLVLRPEVLYHIYRFFESLLR